MSHDFMLLRVEEYYCDGCHKMKSVNVYRFRTMGMTNYLHFCSKCLLTHGKKWGVL